MSYALPSALFIDLNFLSGVAELTTFLAVHVKLTKIAWLRANLEFCGENTSPIQVYEKGHSMPKQFLWARGMHSIAANSSRAFRTTEWQLCYGNGSNYSIVILYATS